MNCVEALFLEREGQPLIYFIPKVLIFENSTVKAFLTFLKMLYLPTASDLLDYSYCDLRQEIVVKEISGKT